MILLLLAAILILFLYLLLYRREAQPVVTQEETAPFAVSIDTQPQIPTPAIDTVSSPIKVDTQETKSEKKHFHSERPKRPAVDTVSVVDTTGKTDSLAAQDSSALSAIVKTQDTLSPIQAGCGGDTSQLWVYPDPSGGLHYKEVRVSFFANRPATIHYRLKDDPSWRIYEEGMPVVITGTTTLYFDAIDTCGNVMEKREEYYEIDVTRKESPCPPDMEQVKVGTMNFCIDRYEWPNRYGVKPHSLISLYQASDSCYSVGKRLCTAEEWMVACAGPYTWKYPYGQMYEPHGCSTHDTTVLASGSKPECRSFFGVFDMSGNLLEWTSTRALENSVFYYLMGGFWESGPKSGCRDRRYSYYPQNRHNPVGFRCCRDIETSSRDDVQGGRR